MELFNLNAKFYMLTGYAPTWVPFPLQFRNLLGFDELAGTVGDHVFVGPQDDIHVGSLRYP